MKILHTISGLDINSGGPSTCTYTLLKGLQNSTIRADILTLDSKKNAIVGNDSFINLVANDVKTFFLYSQNFKNYLQQHNDYDLYHINGLWTYPVHATAKYARQHNKPYIITPHGMLYSNALQFSAWKKKLALSAFQQNDLKQAICLHATSLSEIRHIRDFGLTNPIALIPNCLNINSTVDIRNTENRIKRFGFVGRINRIKNIDILLKSWAKLSNLMTDVELVIIGSGDSDYEKELQQYVQDNTLKNITFYGFLTGNELATTIYSLDFLILPSQSENFGMVVPEALIKGIPVIASKGTPWEELNTHGCGWWVDNDVETLATTIQKAVETPENIRIEMGKRGQELVKNNYSVEVVAAKMIRLYQWILNGGGKPDFVYL
jgi:glycosyltransferase involved in cell wall biosynthesis